MASPSPLLTHLMPQSVTAFLTLAAVTLIVVFLVKRWYDFQLFVRCNIVGPKPHFILGNLKDLDDGNGTKAGSLNLEKKYGKTCGIFFGSMPNIITSDPEVLKQVFIKDFHYFANRKLGIMPPESPGDKILIAIHYERWKPIRSILSPFFSAAKIRKMCPLINKTIMSLVDIVNERLEESKGGEFETDLVPLYQPLALDVLNLSAFGLDTNSQRERHHIYDAALALVEGTNSNQSLKMFLCLICQDLVPLVQCIDKIFGLATPGALMRASQKIIKQRKENLKLNPTSANQDDVIKMMLNYEVDQLKDENDPSKRMTEDEIAMQVLVLIVGGFETTSRSLSYISFQLAKHPDVQDRLYSDICGVLSDDLSVAPTYDDLVELEYLEMVINETLRMCPPAPFGVTNRIASRDCTMPNLLGEDIVIKKGVQVAANMWALHFDPEVWPEPEKFNPERFTKEAASARDPVYYMPFGIGQRNCVARRFALIEIKMAIAQLVRNFEILPSPNEVDVLNPKMMDFGAHNSVKVVLRRRQPRATTRAFRAEE